MNNKLEEAILLGLNDNCFNIENNAKWVRIEPIILVNDILTKIPGNFTIVSTTTGQQRQRGKTTANLAVGLYNAMTKKSNIVIVGRTFMMTQIMMDLFESGIHQYNEMGGDIVEIESRTSTRFILKNGSVILFVLSNDIIEREILRGRSIDLVIIDDTVPVTCELRSKLDSLLNTNILISINKDMDFK